MSLPEDYGCYQNGHVQFEDRDTVLRALERLELSRGEALEVWPARSLPDGIFVSPPRNGWISLWQAGATLHDWFVELTATLECRGVLFGNDDDAGWSVSLFQDGRRIGHCQMPFCWEERGILIGLALEELDDEGVEITDPDHPRVRKVMKRLANTEEYAQLLEEVRRLRFGEDELIPFAGSETASRRAWRCIETGERFARRDDAEYSVTETQTRFAACLGILDTEWDPNLDLPLLQEGDYDDLEGLPAGFEEFVLAPSGRLTVFQD